MGDCRFCLLYKMNMKKFACAAVFAVAMVACVGFFVANEQEESIKYMPSVSALTGTNLFPDEDKASALSDDSDDDDDSSSSDSTPSFEEMFGGGGASSDASSSGSGDTVSSGDSVTVQYKLRLANGKEVYRQWGDGDGGDFSFELGGGHVIPGFDSAVSQMSVGETKDVTIDSDDAYGSKGFKAMGIPPDTDLHYTLKVVGKD